MIGFFGGSFDPVHYGHLKTARAVKKELGLQQLFLMPCRVPVHKDVLHFSNQQRLDMLNLALMEFNDLQIDMREINRQSPSYTIETLKHIKSDYPNEEIFLIIGQDSFDTLETWKDYQKFNDYASVVVLPRTYNNQVLRRDITNVYFAKTPIIDISSTQVQSILSEATSIGKINSQKLSGLLSENIIQYIQKI